MFLPQDCFLKNLADFVPFVEIQRLQKLEDLLIFQTNLQYQIQTYELKLAWFFHRALENELSPFVKKNTFISFFVLLEL